MSRRYAVVDVFTAVPMKGNPVAVVLDAQGLSDADMQAYAAWTNLSETTFVLPATDPRASYRLRIFTPASELPFAGHPTLGSAHAILAEDIAAPRDGRLVQECGMGLVDLAVEGDGQLELKLPAATFKDIAATDLAEVEAALGGRAQASSKPAAVHVGPTWLILPMESAAAVQALNPDMARLAAIERRLGITGVTAFGLHPPGAPAAIEVRSFAPSGGVPEDPVCGSGNGSVAAFRLARGMIAPGSAYVASQGSCVNRAGRIAVHVTADGSIWLGGACVTVVKGTLRL
ncbi:MAG: PhzF family phenazine biosynthesis protein [Burkholderiales bacterium]